jgi:hypothetical protein
MPGAANRADLYVGEPGPRYRLRDLLGKTRAAAPQRVSQPRERRLEVVAWDMIAGKINQPPWRSARNMVTKPRVNASSDRNTCGR